MRDAGYSNHDYFYTNPSVSSDLILTLRDKLGPGAENGRPPRSGSDGFWEIYDGYPGPPVK